MNWTRSSYSADAGNCVELADTGDGTVHVRNSNHPDRGTLALSATAVADFVRACATGELDELTV